MCLHILHFCTSPFPSRMGGRGWSKPSLRQLSPKQASRGRSPLAGVWGCPPECSFAPPFLAQPHPRLPRRFTPRNDRAGDRRRPEGAAPASGESRGVQSHWQAVWRMCLHILHFCTPPLPFRKGAGGWSKPSLRQLSPKQASRGRSPLAGVWGCPPECSFAPPFLAQPHPRLPRRFTPRNDRAGDRRRPEGAAPASGESRGVQPHWQAVWRMCLHDLHFCTSPLPFRKGVGGWSKPSLRQLSPKQASRGRSPRKRGVQRGATPLAGGMEDVPP